MTELVADERHGALRQTLRRLRVLIVLPFTVDPRRTTAGLLLFLVSQMSSVAAAFALRDAVDAVASRDRSGAALAVAVLVIAAAITLGGSWAAFAVRSRVLDLTTLAVDTELTRLTSDVEGIEHLERPEHLDRIRLLQEEHRLLAAIPDAVGHALAVLVRLTVTVVVLATVDPWLLLLPVFAVPSVIASWASQRRADRAWQSVIPLWRLQNAIFGIARTEPGGREIRAFGLQQAFCDRFDCALRDGAEPLTKASLKGSVHQVVGWAVFALAFVGGLLLMARRLVAGQASAGELVLVLTLGLQFNGQITALVAMLARVFRASRAADRLVWLRDYHAVSRAVRVDRRSVGTRLVRGIELRDVTFRYPDTQTDVLSQVSLLLPAGATVALVGDNGAGKSTLAKLLTKMYTPTTGEIRVDETDLDRLDTDDWRAHVTAGFQDFARFELSAQHAIGLGQLPDVDNPAAAIAALDRAQASGVLEDLPDGLATQLGREFDDGHELSGGQWQKIALGRAMMRYEPLLVVLDEPTAALDAAAEAALYAGFATAAEAGAASRGAITLIVTHRFSTVRMADLIVVIDGGRVAETGSHETLMAVNGRYAELYDLQARGYR